MEISRPVKDRKLILPSKRQEKRIRNRLAKKRIKLKRFELGDTQLVTMRVITYRKDVRKTSVFCMCDMNKAPRRIADTIIADHFRPNGQVNQVRS